MLQLHANTLADTSCEGKHTQVFRVDTQSGRGRLEDYSRTRCSLRNMYCIISGNGDSVVIISIMFSTEIDIFNEFLGFLAKRFVKEWPVIPKKTRIRKVSAFKRFSSISRFDSIVFFQIQWKISNLGRNDWRNTSKVSKTWKSKFPTARKSLCAFKVLGYCSSRIFSIIQQFSLNP